MDLLQKYLKYNNKRVYGNFASRKRGTRKADATLPTQPLMIPLLQDIIVVFNMINILILIKSDQNKRLRPDSD